jgi:Mg/Co/Ni transporter MgtE
VLDEDRHLLGVLTFDMIREVLQDQEGGKQP